MSLAAAVSAGSGTVNAAYPYRSTTPLMTAAAPARLASRHEGEDNGEASVATTEGAGRSTGSTVSTVSRSPSVATPGREPLDHWLELRIVVQHPGGFHGLLLSAVNARAELVSGEVRPMVPLRSAPVIALNGEECHPQVSCVLNHYDYCVVQLAVPFRASEATREPQAFELVKAITLFGARADGLGRGLTIRVETIGPGIWKHYMYMPGGFIGFRPSM